MTRCYIVRHGESRWNAEQRWAGQADPALSAKGEEEALAAGAYLATLGFVSVTSSPLQRARLTAVIIARTLAIPLGAPIGELAELDIGYASGLTVPEINARYPGLIDDWHAGKIVEFPGGEGWSDFVQRVQHGLLRLADGEETPVLVVAHEGVMRAINYLLHEPLGRPANLEGRWIELAGARVRAVS